METVGSNNYGKQTQDLADKAAEKVQSGIGTAKDTTNQVAIGFRTPWKPPEAAPDRALRRQLTECSPSPTRQATRSALRPKKCAPQPRTWGIALLRIRGTTRSRRFSYPSR
jgi:hypothetical protein